MSLWSNTLQKRQNVQHGRGMQEVTSLLHMSHSCSGYIHCCVRTTDPANPVPCEQLTRNLQSESYQRSIPSLSRTPMWCEVELILQTTGWSVGAARVAWLSAPWCRISPHFPVCKLPLVSRPAACSQTKDGLLAATNKRGTCVPCVGSVWWSEWGRKGTVNVNPAEEKVSSRLSVWR